MHTATSRKKTCLDVNVQRHQKGTVSLQLLIWTLSPPLHASNFEHVWILREIFQYTSTCGTARKWCMQCIFGQTRQYLENPSPAFVPQI